jgi:hypothetical protein
MTITTTTIKQQIDLQPTPEQVAAFRQKQRRAILVKRCFPDSPVHPYQMRIEDGS